MIENDSIELYQGVYKIENKSGDCLLKGTIAIKWFPIVSVYFEGVLNTPNQPQKKSFMANRLMMDSQVSVYINDLKIGQGIVTSFSSNNWSITGVMSGDVTIGDSSICVDTIEFSIVNLREIKRISDADGNTQFLRFGDGSYLIEVFPIEGYSETISSLKNEGGYKITHTGKISKKDNNSICITDAQNKLEKLKLYLSFLNGQTTGLILINGFFKGESMWTNAGFTVFEPFDNSIRWSPRSEGKSFEDSYPRFLELWTESEDTLKALINWYLEVNRDGFRSSKIVMCQAGLELCYNWLIIEEKKLLIGKDSESITAANKIRLLLSELGVDRICPQHFTDTQSLIDNSNYAEVKDVVDAIVYIRNAITHSNMAKRNEVASIEYMAKFQTLQLAISYLELAILFILKYNGLYISRLDSSPMEMDCIKKVPWG